MTFKGNKVIVHILYFPTPLLGTLPSSGFSAAGGDLSTTQLSETKVNALGTAIIECLNNETSASNELELRLIQLQYPYLDRSILGQYLALMQANINFLRMKKKLFTVRLRSNRTKSHSKLIYLLD